MPVANKTPCGKPSKGTSQEVLVRAHKLKMNLKKAAIAHEYNTVGSKRRYRIEANLSKRHSKHGQSPKAAY